MVTFDPSPIALSDDIKAEIREATLAYFKNKAETEINRYKADVLDPIFAKHNCDYRQFVSSGTGALRRFVENYLTDFVQLTQRTVNGGIQQYCSLCIDADALKAADDTHAMFVRLITDMMRENGGRVFLSHVGMQLAKRGIDYKEYSAGMKLQTWLETAFADEFAIDGQALVPSAPLSSVSDTHAMLVRLLAELVKENGGRVLLSSIGPLLSNKYGIDYKEHSGGKTLQTWLKTAFANEFEIDGYHLVTASGNKEAEDNVPGEVAQMHSLAFMLWWSNHARVLNTYAGESKTAAEWSLAVARGLAQALLGVAPSFTYAVENSTKFVFDTTIKTAGGKRLYCVLRPNPQSENGWQYLFDSFCCIAEDDTALAAEMKLNVPEILRFDNLLDDKYEELKLDMGLIKQSREILHGAWERFSNCVATGAAVDAETMAQLRVYHNHWKHLLGVAETLGWNTEALTLDAVAAQLESGHRKHDVLNAAIGELANFLEPLKEFFTDYNWLEVAAVVERDITAITTTLNSWEHIAALKEILLRYERLMRATKLTELDDAMMDAAEQFNRDFGSKRSVRVFFGVMAGAGENEAEGGVWDKALPTNLLQRLSAEDTVEEAPAQALDTDRLLAAALQRGASSTLLLLENARNVRLTRFEQAVAVGDFASAKAMIATGEAEDGHTSPDELTSILDELASDDVSLALYDCAIRLYQTLGNTNKLPETYLIFGMYLGEKACLEALLELYITENQAEKFFAVWEAFEKHPLPTAEKIHPLLYMLATRGERVLTAYLDERVSVCYVPAYAKALKDVLSNFNFPALRERCERCFAHVADNAEINEFEKLMLESASKADLAAVLQYLPTFAKSAEEHGYTEDEIHFFTQTLSAGQMDQDEDLTPEERLYALQKNKNGTVERALWESLLSGNKLHDCLMLLTILHDEQRYEEVCTLFECYQSLLTKNPDARALYILGLAHRETADVPPFVLENLQDCLQLMVENQWPEDTPAAYAAVQALQPHLEDPVARSIATVSYHLGVLATDTDALAAFGLDDEQRKHFLSVYRTGAFPRGRDPLSIAERLRAFGGIQHPLTLTLAQWALDCGHTAAVPLLWEIYTAKNDRRASLELLTQHPAFRATKETELLSLLIEQKEYRAFLEHREAVADSSAVITAQTVIAKGHLGLPAAEDVLALQAVIDEVPAALLAEVTEALLVGGAPAEALTANELSALLSRFTAAEIAAIVTGNGRAEREHLEALQRTVADTDLPALVYLYEAFGVGDMSEASEAFFNETLQALDEQDNRDETLRMLKNVYAKNSAYTVKIMLHEIAEMGLSADNKETVCRKIEDAMDGVALSEDDIYRCMDLFQEYNLPLSNSIVEAFVTVCREHGSVERCIEFFCNLPPAQLCEDVPKTLCELFADALRTAQFRREWQDSAQTVFTSLLDKTVTACYGLYALQKQFGTAALAKVSLFLLLLHGSELPMAWQEELEDEAVALGFTDDTTLMTLFAEMAENASVQEIEEYCRFCRPYYLPEKQTLEDYYREVMAAEEGESYSVGVHLLKLLCIDTKKAEYWQAFAQIPWDANTNVYAKLLYGAALLMAPTPTTWKQCLAAWKQCLAACERASSDELFAEALIACAKQTHTEFNVEFRKHLTERCEANSLYFLRLGEENAERLVAELCRCLESAAAANAVGHSTLRDLTIIAVATNSDKAYETLLAIALPQFQGMHNNLGFATACRLLLEKRFTQAAALLKAISATVGAKYPQLTEKLCAMSTKELEAFCAEETNETLLRLVLPDGNAPDIHKIHDLVLNHITEKQFEQGAKLLYEVVQNQTADYGSYMGLFILSQYLPQNPEYLHTALFGLLKNKPRQNAAGYYLRKEKDFAMLLANIDAVLEDQNKTDDISRFDDYDFGVGAKDYYQQSVTVLNERDPIPAAVQDCHDTIANLLHNQPEEIKTILYSLVFGFVTTNWYDFFLRCYREKADVLGYLRIYETVKKHMGVHFNGGMTRSILRVAYDLAPDEAEEFIAMLETALNPAEAEKEEIDKLKHTYTHIDAAITLYRNKYYLSLPKELIDDNFLLLPLEENSIAEPLFHNTVNEVTPESSRALYSCAMLVGSIARTINVMSRLWQAAMEAFEAKNNRVAHVLFNAMLELNKTYELANNTSYTHTKKPRETYESLARVCGAFAGEADVLAKIGTQKFHSWSAINMALSLLYTARADEIHALRGCMAPNNAKLVDTLLTFIDGTVSNKDKCAALMALDDDVSRGILCYMMLWKTYQGYWFLTDEDEPLPAHRVLEDELVRVAEAYPKMFAFTPKANAPQYTPRHYILWEPQEVRRNATVIAARPKVITEQPPVVTETATAEDTETTVVLDAQAVRALSFVSRLEAVTDTAESEASLRNKRNEIPRISTQNKRDRLAISEQLYRMALGREAEATELLDFAFRYGADYYYVCIDQKQYDDANRVLLEMAALYSPAYKGPGVQALKDAVCTSALYELLNRGYTSACKMAEEYANHKAAFRHLQSMLPVAMKEESDSITRIYNALSMIAKQLDNSEPENTALRDALVNAKKLVAKVQNNRWNQLCLDFAKMIQDEISKINCRPLLSITLFDDVQNTPSGYLYGLVENIGGDAAEDVTLYVDCNNGFVSETYTLPRLDKKEEAAFELAFASPQGTTKLDFNLFISYRHKTEQHTRMQTGTVIIHEAPLPVLPDKLFTQTSQNITDFALQEDGSVASENFYGRNAELKIVRGIFAQSSFALYKNMLVKGIRRAGKTSVLNYLKAYANLTRSENTLAVYVDCSGIHGDQAPIHAVFVDHIIAGCSLLNPEAPWDVLKQKYALQPGEDDCKAENLQYFYRELKTYNNKGLMLVLDEFDILLEEFEKHQGKDKVNNTLLPALRALMNNPDCQEAVHLVICGSNKLIRYNDTVTYNQFFEQFGDNILQIGHFPKDDLTAMIESVCAKHPDVTFHPETIDWIWKYTDGMVWYSQMLANNAFERAVMLGRCVVYPYDVAVGMERLIALDNLFKSVIENCLPEERKLLDLLQSLTPTATKEVPIAQLQETLSGEFTSEEIGGFIRAMENIQIVERRGNSLRFATELYWHYFRKLFSNYNYPQQEEYPAIFSAND